MTRRADYTGAEWALLICSLELVGLGMIAVSKSGPIGKLRELNALSRCLIARAMPAHFKRNELVLALLADAHSQATGPFTFFSGSAPSDLAAEVATARLRTLICCEQVAALLARKTPWAEAEGLKRWLLWIARSVAEASGDGWLGLGRKVSDEEALMLHQIATALHSSSLVPIPTPAELEVMLGLAPHDAGKVSGSGDSQEYPARRDR